MQINDKAIPSILIISARYPPAICGVGDHSVHLLHFWRKKGYSVYLATLSAAAAGEGVFIIPEAVGERKVFLTALLKQYGIGFIF